MNDKLNMENKSGASVKRGRKGGLDLGWKGRFHVVCKSRDGAVKWEDDAQNALTNVGANDLLDILFNAGTQDTYYLGLINDGETLANGDTYQSHSGWTENTAYDEAARPTWNPGAATSRSVTNGTAIDFSINTDSQVIAGVFLANDDTKGDSSAGPILVATALFTGGDKGVDDGDTLQVTYTVSL